MDVKLRKVLFTTLSALSMAAVSGAAIAQTAPAITAAPGGFVSNLLDGAAPGTVTVAGITVYGTIDVGFAYNSHAAAKDTIGSNYIDAPYLLQNSSQRARFSYQNNALAQSNVGLKGSQSIGDLVGVDGLKSWQLGFLAQTDFNPLYGSVGDILKSEARNNGVPVNQRSFGADGSRAGQIFNNQAYVSLKQTVLGELRFGRNNTLLLDEIGAYDPQSGSYSLSPLAFSGTIGGGGGDTEDPRWNNSFKYTNTIGPVRVGAAYRFDGGGQGGNAWAFGGGTDGTGILKGWSVDGTYTKENSIISTGILTDGNCQAQFGKPANNPNYLADCQSSNFVTGTIQDTETWSIAAKYKFDQTSFLKGATVMGGYEHIENSNPSGSSLTNLSTIGGYQLLNAGGANGINVNPFVSSRSLDVFWIGGRYAFTPKLTGATAFYYDTQNTFKAGSAGQATGFVPAAASCNGQTGRSASPSCSGSLYFYSVSLDYQLTQRLDLYAGASWDNVTGGQSSGFLATNEYNIVSGVRFRF